MYSKIKKMYSNVYQVCMSLMSIIYKSVSFCLDGMHGIFIYLYRPEYFHTQKAQSSVSLLFYFDVSCQNGGYFALHESPRYVGAHQGAFLAARTVHFSGRTLLFDALPGAREAELVRRHRRALHKVCVLQPLVAKRAAQRDAAGNRGVWDALRMHRIHARNVRHHGALCQPPLVGRKRAAAISAGGRVHLVGVLGRAVSASVVRGQNERRDGRTSILARGLRRGGARVRGYCGGRGGEAGRWHRGHFQSVSRREPLLSISVNLGSGATLPVRLR